ncbi:MAG: hypothetical protein N5P05_002371 [Chroococcopsis gigantea SAG 12.99]|nr:hypothetical protein [Chroococcopsis gigantea SAG 12.99]
MRASNVRQSVKIKFVRYTTTAGERKEMLGLLIKQVAITPRESPTRQTHIAILWHTGATDELSSSRPSQAQKLSTSGEVIAAVRVLTPLIMMPP